MTDLFISDLHLHPSRPASLELFTAFVDEQARDAERLFILGDLFEYWLGDDAIDHCGYGPVIDRLAALARSTTHVLFMHGNRDFLVGQDFATRCGAALLPDPTCVELDGETVLLMHGDSLCTDDTEHQAFRRESRSPEWQQRILALDLVQREAIAQQLRLNSEAGKQVMDMAIMDVNDVAVETVMREHGTRLLIHGHTHRLAIHDLTVDGRAAHRIVLGDWYTQGSYLVRHADEYRLMSYPDNRVLGRLRIPAGDSRRHASGR